MVARHGASVSQRLALLDCLHRQPFPNPGRFVEFPAESPGNKVNKVQRLLDGRLEDIDLRVLFERLNETVVLHVLGTVLLERKLIFVSQNLRFGFIQFGFPTNVVNHFFHAVFCRFASTLFSRCSTRLCGNTRSCPSFLSP